MCVGETLTEPKTAAGQDTGSLINKSINQEHKHNFQKPKKTASKANTTKRNMVLGTINRYQILQSRQTNLATGRQKRIVIFQNFQLKNDLSMSNQKTGYQTR